MIFKKDSPFLGLFLGLFIPMIFYFLQIYFLPILIGQSFSKPSMQLFALICNIPFFRYYLLNLKFERTGKGIFFATFVYALIWIYTNKGII